MELFFQIGVFLLTVMGEGQSSHQLLFNKLSKAKVHKPRSNRKLPLASSNFY